MLDSAVLMKLCLPKSGWDMQTLESAAVGYLRKGSHGKLGLEQLYLRNE